jgi:flagellar hook-length control protein FliK
MINEISNASQLISQSGNANVEEGSGENVKEAFLALLQGIAGIIPQASSMHSHLPEMQRITDDRPKKSESMDTPKEKQFSDLPGEKKNETGKSEILSSGKTELPKNNEISNISAKNTPTEQSTVAKDTKTESMGEATPKSNNPGSITQESKELQNSIQDYNGVPEVKSNVTKDIQSEVKPSQSDTKTTVNSNMAKPQEVLSSIENQLKHAGKELEQVVSKVKADLDTSSNLNMKKSVSELYSQIEVLSNESDENSDLLGKTLFNMLVKADTTDAPDILTVDTNKINLHTYLNAFTMQSLAAEGEIKSMLSLKSEVESIITTAKNNLERSQAQAKTNGTEAGPRQQVYVDKVKEVMEKAVINKTTDSVTVKIDPPHLGEITVKVVQKGKEVYAKLTSESSEVEHTLRTRMHELQGVLQSLGFKADEVYVSIGKNFEESTQFSQGHQAGHENANKHSNNEGNSRSQSGRDQGVKDVLRAFPRTQSTLDEGGWVA